MNVVQLMVTIIIVTILVTVILGVVSYIAYWLRRSRGPIGTEEVESELRFFYRYVPRDEEEAGNHGASTFANGAFASADTEAATLVN
jgi:Trk-type K+ transport system membrane component